MATDYRRKTPAGTPGRRSPTLARGMAVIDVAGYVAELKDHAVDHGFHVHDERHFVETYSLRQFWEVDLHPEEGCGGPIDLHLALEVDPRTLLDFEDAVVALPEDEDPPTSGPSRSRSTGASRRCPRDPTCSASRSTSLASEGSTSRSRSPPPTRSARSPTPRSAASRSSPAQQVSLARVLAGEELLCDTFDRALGVTRSCSTTCRSGSENRLPWPMLVAGCIVFALVSGGLLTGCSSQASSLASQACAHVERGLAMERKASSATGARATLLKAEALDQVRAALPLAALAAGEDTSWQALEATLSESSPCANQQPVLTALSDQCSSPGGDG